MAAAQQPGAAFLRRRLARAQAVPPDERSPEVQAFITSVELGRQACELLPLRRSGGGEPRPALPLGNPATTRRVLRAVLKVVQADHLCPDYAVFNPDIYPHLDGYNAALHTATTRGSFIELASLLDFYWQFSRVGGIAPDEQLRACTAVPAVLANSAARAAICRQLEQLSAEQPEGQQPFTWLQLEGACQAALIDMTKNLVMQPLASGSTDAQRRTARSARQAAIAAWRQLEPGNLNSVARTAVSAPMSGPDPAHLQPLRRALQLAQQQRSPYWVVRCASAGLVLTVAIPCEASVFRAVIEGFGQVEPALRSCMRVLPQPWVTGLSAAHQAGATALPLVRSRLAALESAAAGGTVDPAAGMQQVGHFLASMMQQRQALDSRNDCAGCRQHAVGLRACSRCRKVFYCSVECQRSHWQQHKRECRPA